MEEEELAALAAQLKALKTGKEIIAFRNRLSREQARAVIRHASISPVERGAIILALHFSGPEMIKDKYRWASEVNFGDSRITSSDDEQGPARPIFP
jgi:hypothetical protein